MFVCAHISPKEENQPEPKPQESVASSYPAQILPFTFDEGTERRHPLRKERGVTQNTHTLVATSRPAIIVWAPCVRPAGALIKGGGGAGQLSQGGEKKATNDSIYLSIYRPAAEAGEGGEELTFNIAIRTYDVCALPISYTDVSKNIRI